MSESPTRCVIDGNMEVSHRRVAAPVVNMEVSHRRVAAPMAKKKASRRRAASPVANMRQPACRGGMLVVKPVGEDPGAWRRWPGRCGDLHGGVGGATWGTGGRPGAAPCACDHGEAGC